MLISPTSFEPVSAALCSTAAEYPIFRSSSAWQLVEEVIVFESAQSISAVDRFFWEMVDFGEGGQFWA